MKAVVTGATGHLGGYVVHELLELGFEVVAVSRSGKTPDAPFEMSSTARARGLALDLTQDGAVAPLVPELGSEVALVHLANWNPPASPALSSADRAQLVELNVLGTLRVLDAARAGVGVVVYASTCEVYGVPEGAGPVKESARLMPLTDYAACKLSGEDHLLAFAYEEHKRAVALRFAAMYGPGSAPCALSSLLRQTANAERPTVYGDRAELRDQVHVRDAARSIVCAVRSSARGIFNVSDGRPQSIAECARAVLSVSGLGGEPHFRPDSKPRADLYLDVDLARAELNFESTVTLRDGMLEELRWLRTWLRPPAY
jgi:nucleoside-diphosphate-sugar epimerase